MKLERQVHLDTRNKCIYVDSREYCNGCVFLLDVWGQPYCGNKCVSETKRLEVSGSSKVDPNELVLNKRVLNVEKVLRTSKCISTYTDVKPKRKKRIRWKL